MPDEPAVQDVGAQAQALGADILAKLDTLTQQPVVAPAGNAAAGVSMEERKRLAKAATDQINAIVAEYLAQMKTQQTTSAEEEIQRIKAGIGVQ